MSRETKGNPNRFPLWKDMHEFNFKICKMMVHHPSSPTEISAVDTVGAAVHASQTTPTRTEAAKEEETLKSLVDILQQVMRSVPTQGTPAQHSAVTPTLTDTIDALWLKVYRKHAKKQKHLENVAMARKPTPSTPPSVLTLQTDPDISVVVCVYESTQLTTALKELALIFQAAATKKEK